MCKGTTCSQWRLWLSGRHNLELPQLWLCLAKEISWGSHHLVQCQWAFHQDNQYETSHPGDECDIGLQPLGITICFPSRIHLSFWGKPMVRIFRNDLFWQLPPSLSKAVAVLGKWAGLTGHGWKSTLRLQGINLRNKCTCRWEPLDRLFEHVQSPSLGSGEDSAWYVQVYVQNWVHCTFQYITLHHIAAKRVHQLRACTLSS